MIKTHNSQRLLLTLMAVVFTLSACGGGGSGEASVSNTISPSVPSTNEPTWQAGVYPDSSNFIAQCQTPRTGADPFSGEPFADRQGSALSEKLWLRSWTHETYLWFDEVPDNDPNNFSIPAYFAQLKTDELTASGKPKDNFHFSQSTQEYNERTQAGTVSEYGLEWEFVANRAPRKLLVRYTEPNSPAARANIPRGASLQKIDDIDFVNTTDPDQVDFINDALFPTEAGSTYTFEFVTVDGDIISEELSSAVIELSPVQNVHILNTARGQLGYFQFNTFITPSQRDLIDAFQSFVDNTVTDLVIDLRYNGGGSLALSSQLAYMIAGPNQTDERVFEGLRYNSKRASPAPIPFYNREIDYVNGVFMDSFLPSLELTRVFILSSDNTCSASESLINGLRGIDVEVILVGDTTCGKPFGFFPEDNCGTTYFTIQLQGINDKGFGEYADGFSPIESPVFQDQVKGCRVADDFNNALGSTNEEMLATAIFFAENNACPENLTAPETIDVPSAIEDGPAIATPNRFLEAILNEDRTRISKGVN